MRCKFPSHLYIRVDRDLRSALNDGARASGEPVSAFARRELRAVLTTQARTAGNRRAASESVGR